MADPKPKPRNDKQEEFNEMLDNYLEDRKDSLGALLKELFTPAKGESFLDWLKK